MIQTVLHLAQETHWVASSGLTAWLIGTSIVLGTCNILATVVALAIHEDCCDPYGHKDPLKKRMWARRTLLSPFVGTFIWSWIFAKHVARSVKGLVGDAGLVIPTKQIEENSGQLSHPKTPPITVIRK